MTIFHFKLCNENVLYGLSPSNIKQAFKDFNLDIYPLEVYQYIFDAVQVMDYEPLEYPFKAVYILDVIAWNCDLDYKEYTSEQEKTALLDTLEKHTQVIHTDEENGTIYHLAY